MNRIVSVHRDQMSAPRTKRNHRLGFEGLANLPTTIMCGLHRDFVLLQSSEVKAFPAYERMFGERAND